MKHFGLAKSVSETLAKRSFVTVESISVLAVTFNVNAKIEDFAGMGSIFRTAAGCPDIIIFGQQEVVELSTTNVVGSAILGNQLIAERVDRWQTLVLSAINSFDSVQSYSILSTSQMVGTVMTIFVLDSKIRDIKKLQVGCIPRGLGNVLGNKGGVCVRF